MNAAHKMELFIIQDFPKMDGYHGRVVWGQGGCNNKGESVPHTYKSLDFACNLHNRVHFKETIKTRGSNPMLQPKLQILLMS